MARGRINIPLNYMPPAEVGTSEPTLPARKLPEVGLQSLEGAASVAKPIAEMLPGSGFVTGVQKGGSEGGADVLAELLAIIGGFAGSVGGPAGTAAGYTIGKGSVKGLRSLLNNLNDYQAAWKAENKLANRQKQKDSVSKAAVKLDEGKITSKEFKNIVERDLPIKPIENMVEVPSFENIIGALKKPQVEEGIINLNKKLKNGTRVATRLDIPAYDKYNQWIVSIHDGIKAGGKAIGYGKTAVLNNVEFKSSAKGALNIAKTKAKGGTDKGTIARIHGDWKNVDDNLTAKRAERILANKKDNKYIDPEDDSEWVQVGMNPFRSSYFYDKLSRSPLKSAEEVIQVGPLVFAKGSIRAKPSDFKKEKTMVVRTKGNKIIPFKKGGSITERNPYNYEPRAI
jgi:hypothetical protein